MQTKMFNVMRPQDKKLNCPAQIPWAIIDPHRRQAERNHGQSLERLDERGGLDPTELFAVLTDRDWRDVFKTTTEFTCVAYINEAIEKWASA